MIKNKHTFYLIMPLIFISSIFSMERTKSNYAEMGLALSLIPVSIAAQHRAVNYGNQAALPLHLTSDVIKILNKMLFFYNNQQFQNDTSSYKACVVNGALLLRDLTKLYVHLKDYILLNIASNKEELLEEISDFVGFDVLAKEEVQKNEENEFQQLEIKTTMLFYAVQVYVLPILDGLSAFALAVSQDKSLYYSNEHTQNISTVIHSLIRVSQEYIELENDSPYKKVLACFLIAQTCWLIYELKICYERLQCSVCVSCNKSFLKINTAYLQCSENSCCKNCIVQYELSDCCDGKCLGKNSAKVECAICCNENVPTCRIVNLTCCSDNFVCKFCFKNYILEQINTYRSGGNGQVVDMPCPSCSKAISDAQISLFLKNDPKIYNDYIGATLDDYVSKNPNLRHCQSPNCTNVYEPSLREDYTCPSCHQTYCSHCCIAHSPEMSCENAKKFTPEELSLEGFILTGAAMRCPNPDGTCKRIIEKNFGCDHMICGGAGGQKGSLGCNYEFCWICGGPWRGLNGCANTFYSNPPHGGRPQRPGYRP